MCKTLILCIIAVLNQNKFASLEGNKGFFLSRFVVEKYQNIFFLSYIYRLKFKAFCDKFEVCIGDTWRIRIPERKKLKWKLVLFSPDAGCRSGLYFIGNIFFTLWHFNPILWQKGQHVGKRVENICPNQIFSPHRFSPSLLKV